MMVCACHPRYAGGINRRIMIQASPGKIVILCSKKKEKKKDWRCDPSRRVPAYHTQGPEFKFYYLH
jgi:intein-encoded DNA endonuclease-like protein